MLGLHEARSFDLLVRFLTQPDHQAWAKYAAISAIVMPSTVMVSEVVADTLRAEVLNTGSVTLPAGGGTLFAGLFERKFSDGAPMFGLITIAPKEAVMQGDPRGIECVARFFDEPGAATQPGFKAAWVGFLRAFNIFQFLPHGFFVSSRGLQTNAYATLADSFSRSTGPKPPDDHPELVELLGLTDPEAHSLLRLISSEGLPLPEPGYELAGIAGEVVATAELAWPKFKLALLLDEETESEAVFIEAQWTIQFIATAQSNPQEFMARLYQANQQGGTNAN